MGERERPGQVGAVVVDVAFEGDYVLLFLADGRALSAPIGWAGPAVAKMSADARPRWAVTPDGCGVFWPAVAPEPGDGVLDVWSLEQDALFEEALADLAARGHDTDAVDMRTRELVTLWRLLADGHNGGLMQFLGNWGDDEVHRARKALQKVGADATEAAVQEFWSIVAPVIERGGVASIDALYAAFSPEQVEALEGIDTQFWAVSGELSRLIPLAYGPARSARP
jgi:hypothetical protein